MRDAIPKFIGATVKRREDPDLVTGKGLFVADLELEHPVWMAFVRSPWAHANVKRVDTARALGMPGVLTVFTADDLNPLVANPFPFLKRGELGTFEEVYEQRRFPLASDRVRHVGEPVAVVVAEDPYLAADAAEAVAAGVEYEPLPAVTDPEAALADGAPRLHDDCAGNRGFVWSASGGNLEEAFGRADKVVELRATIQRLVPNAMEPRAVAATYDPADGYTLWASTQIPHQLKGFLESMIGVEPGTIRVIAPEVGGGFGAKVNLYTEDVLSLVLAKQLRRAVRWTASRSEDYVTTSHGRDQIGTMRLGVTNEGRILGAELEIVMDCGAYFSRVTPVIPVFTGVMMTGVYDIQNVRTRAVGVFTNKVMSEPYRGAGRPEATYFLERAIDKVADELSIDPTEIRRRNFIKPDQFPYKTQTGLTYDNGEYEIALDRVLEHIDYGRLRMEQRERLGSGGKLLGIGVASYVEICGFGPFEHGSVSVAADGKVTVLSGTSPHGQGHKTSWAQITADTLQVPMEDITVIHGDTAVVPKGIGTFGSRSAPVGGAAVYESADAVREGATKIAAHLLEASASDVRLEDGAFHVVGMKSRSLSWAEVAAAAHSEDLPDDLEGALENATDFKPAGDTYPFGTHAAVVEIDPETGEIKILRFVTNDDCGNVINPLIVQGQVHGGIAQGIGQALWEGASYDPSGNLTTGNLMEYAVPRADFFPLFETNRTETPTPLNVLGVKGIGEAATIGSTPAVVNAVVDALSHLDVTHVDTPLRPQKIFEILSSTR